MKKETNMLTALCATLLTIGILCVPRASGQGHVLTFPTFMPGSPLYRNAFVANFNAAAINGLSSYGNFQREENGSLHPIESVFNNGDLFGTGNTMAFGIIYSNSVAFRLSDVSLDYDTGTLGGNTHVAFSGFINGYNLLGIGIQGGTNVYTTGGGSALVNWIAIFYPSFGINIGNQNPADVIPTYGPGSPYPISGTWTLPGGQSVSSSAIFTAPEPGTYALMAFGLTTLLLFHRRRAKN